MLSNIVCPSSERIRDSGVVNETMSLTQVVGSNVGSNVGHGSEYPDLRASPSIIPLLWNNHYDVLLETEDE